MGLPRRIPYNFGMRRIVLSIAVICAVLTAAPAHPPMGRAVSDSIEVAAVFMDAVAVKQATGSDFSSAYTVIEVTVTPKGGKSVDVQPEDFLLRISSDADSSGPVAASQVLGAGGGLVLHREPERIGINSGNNANVGLTAGATKASVSAADIAALQSKMLAPKTTANPVTGLLFFPIAKKKPRDLDLVYSTPGGKLHIAFK